MAQNAPKKTRLRNTTVGSYQERESRFGTSLYSAQFTFPTSIEQSFVAPKESRPGKTKSSFCIISRESFGWRLLEEAYFMWSDHWKVHGSGEESAAVFQVRKKYQVSIKKQLTT